MTNATFPFSLAEFFSHYSVFGQTSQDCSDADWIFSSVYCEGAPIFEEF